MDYTISRGFALDVADGWVFKQFVAAACHTAKRKVTEQIIKSLFMFEVKTV